MRLAGLRELVRNVADFCYPGRCAVCESEASGAAPLCEACVGELRQLEQGAACDRCAMPLADPEDPCPYCLGKGARHYERIVRLGVFRDPIKKLVHQLKYNGRWPLTEHLGMRLREQNHVKRLLAEAECLVPVPLHRLRQMSRGYNQADVLARTLASGMEGLRVVRPAVRVRHTETQTQFHSRAQRMENLRDAFGLVRPQPIRGRRVVVVDDVMTTGATLLSFARTLRTARPASVCAIVIAVADPKGADFQLI